MSVVLVAESRDDWLGGFEGVQTIDPSEYLSHSDGDLRRGTKIYNLCRSYSYQSMGYYVSLLAEARGQRPIPDVMTMQDLRGVAAVRLIPQSLEDVIQKSLQSLTADDFTLSVYFGENLAKKYDRLARELYGLFQAPLLRFRFSRRSKWRLRRASAIALNDIPVSHRDFVASAATRHFARGNSRRAKRVTSRYDLAILHNPDEGQLAPSDPVALKRMLKAAARLGIAAELITREDAGRLLEFDALFIRETTAISHHTYQLARRAEAAGLVVIDDPLSILRCTNKVYLAELLNRAKILTPKTMVVHPRNMDQVAEQLKFPCVLKRPDSAFSKGVVKANDPAELSARLAEFFCDSELVIAQEYMRTDFDWRIGILDQRPLFACKYHMARGHWQIAKHAGDEQTKFGSVETLPVELAPRKAVAVALKAANLIGDGFYGVDVKEAEGKFFVIEVNDNPNLDAGVEDTVLRDDLYRRIMESFIRRIEQRKQPSLQRIP
ncbi:Ribosomal protein S6 modification protein [Roseimaritima multifibrata]|uniref:Ribosomal protein S6 modification protein n=1 Tax=Roseimaritima multifibrata TaxID=1930274 RepID=A0A517MHZ7_9BACT|nr:RimK family protein [Roseimaritima multifibrata]QDS94500.1 Ribosomal protein S6 modification protein [Roseimaritima multifibrata]